MIVAITRGEHEFSIVIFAFSTEILIFYIPDFTAHLFHFKKSIVAFTALYLATNAVAVWNHDNLFGLFIGGKPWRGG